ncbi:MAG TPA: 16S rRNA (uracil(1498)-N(3))-methyltransferase [Dongiaceae bacterium]
MKPEISTRLYVEAPLSAGAAVEIDGDRAHYLRDVLRLKADAPLRLFNGRDGEWRAAIGKLTKSGGRLAVETQTRPQEAAPDLWLAFAATKRASIDLIAEKATELGISRLQPVLTRNTHVDRVNTERLRAIAVEAAEQCERLSVPEVRAPIAFARLLTEWPASRRIAACLEAGAARPIAEVFSAYAADTTRAWGILVGPEGGWAPAELDAINKSPTCIPVGLGPRILRAETAALAAIACWQAILGDKNQRPPLRD